MQHFVKSENLLVRLVRKMLSLRSEATSNFFRTLSAIRIIILRTDVRRWTKVAAESPPWDERNRIIASLIPCKSSVLDLGSGAQTLRKHLKHDCVYQPCDIVKSSKDVILCNFNAGVYPEL